MGVSRLTQEIVTEAPVSQTVLEKQFAKNSKGEAIPSVLNIKKLIFKNAVAQAVTNFKDGQDNQEIAVLGDGFTTINNNANIQTNTGANKLLTNGLVYHFTKFLGKWREDA